MTDPKDASRTVDFGYEQVPIEDKVRRVGDVFRSVAPKYDVMNDLVAGHPPHPQAHGHRACPACALVIALDLAGGTGDLSPCSRRAWAETVRSSSPTSIPRCSNSAAIACSTPAANTEAVIADAEQLPFESNSFDCVTIAFGLRNVTRKDVALAEMCRVLHPGGRLLVLEFSKPRNPLLSRAYDAFAATWPMMGKLIADDADSYRYLNESIRMHPPQEELASMMEQAGFDAVRFHDLLGGIVAIHRGIAP